MGASVYIESSVISYLASRPSRDLVIAGRQAITAEWWKKSKSLYELYVSPLVLEEVSAGDPVAAKQRLDAIEDFPSVSISDDAQSVAEALISAKAVPANSERDALHIAIAATQGFDYLLTWNFKHINNANMQKPIINVIADFGYSCPILCSPEELIGGNDAE